MTKLAIWFNFLTTQLNNFLALENGFNHALEANEVALNSAGSAAKEQERYLAGLEAKSNAVKASFEKLSASILDSGLIKGLLDLANAFLKLLNTPIGRFLTQVTLLSGVFGGLNTIFGRNIIGPIAKQFVTAFKLMTGQMVIFTGKAAIMKAVAFPAIVAISAAVVGIIALAPKIHEFMKEQSDASYKAQKELEGLNEQLSENENRLEELNKIPYKNRSDAINEEIEALEEENKALRENIELKKGEVSKADFEKLLRKGSGIAGQNGVFAGTYAGYVPPSTQTSQTGYAPGSYLGATANTPKASPEQEIEKFYREYLEAFKKISAELEAQAKEGIINPNTLAKYEEYKDKLDEIFDASEKLADSDLDQWVIDLRKEFNELPDISEKVADSYYSVAESLMYLTHGMVVNDTQYQQLLKVYPELDKVLNKTENGYEANTESLAKMLTEMSSTKGVAGELADTYNRLVSGLSVGKEEINALVKAFPALSAMIQETNGQFYLEVEALTEAAKAGNQWAISMIKSQEAVTRSTIEQIDQRIKAMYAEIRALQAKMLAETGEINDTRIMQYRKAMSSLIEQREELEALLGATNVEFPSLGDIQSGSGSGSHEKETDPIKEQSKLFKEQLAILEHKLYLMQKTGASEEDQIAHIKEMQKLVHEQAEWFREHGVSEDSEYIRELQKQWWQYEEQIQGIYKDQASIYEMLFGAVAEKAQDEIDALEKKKAEIQEQNEALEDQIELEKALDALARAKQKKVLVYKDGRFQYAQDADAVSKAQAEVNRIKKEQEKQKELDAIDKEIDKWQEYKDKWSSVVSDYTKQQDLLLIEQKLGIKLEGENWEKRLGNLADYVKRYNELMAKAGQTGGSSAKPNGHYASGTTSARGGISLVGETGPELRLLNHGDGILPADITKNLWQWGAIDPSRLVSGAVGNLRNLGNSVSIAIENFNPNLPNVTDGEGFANYMKNNFYRDAIQFAR